MKCTFCGAELNDKTYFCTECGRAIESAPEYEFVKTDKKAGKTLGIVSLVLGIVSVVLLLFSLVNICCCLGTMSPIAMITNLVSFALAVPGVIIASIASKKAKAAENKNVMAKVGMILSLIPIVLVGLAVLIAIILLIILAICVIFTFISNTAGPAAH